ncbi:PDZ domain-containing protein MAGIX isoform X4 [Hippopotamus amphibius kiboko]|uniref:PDZ domain-containing protein MAGIX isoform X4 n=1 Tax=Hippopotamus amphibius kiboko TaxID=575201 RepID=UPI002592AEFB|nr:PDZ domain-containing protein MAGIX isoform X4 [Hippopotamus amphibius kiboko]
MERRAGGATDPKGSRGGRGLGPPAGSSARQLLARLDARPLAARAAADVAALVRRAGATLRLRPKEAISVLDSADIEVTDSRLPNATFVEHRLQHRRSETSGTRTGPPQVTPDRSPDPGGPEVTRSRSASASPLHHPRPRTTPKTRGSLEPSPEGVADGPAVSPPERRTEDPSDQTPDSPGPWLVPSEERLSRALGVRGTAQLALETAAGRRRH